MSKFVRGIAGVSVAAALLWVGGIAAAQEQERPQQGQQRERQFQQGQQRQQQGQQIEQYLAAWILIENEAAIELAELGRQQAQNPEVKEFAATMVQEHRELSQKLEQIAGPQLASIITRGRQQQGRQQTTQDLSQQRQQQQQAGGDTAEQLIQIHQQAQNQFCQTLKRGLEEKQGQQFDQTFVGLEVIGHMKIADLLKVAQQRSSGQLQQTLQQAQQTVQQHLQQAEQLNEQLEGSRQARRPQQQQQQQDQQQ